MCTRLIVFCVCMFPVWQLHWTFLQKIEYGNQFSEGLQLTELSKSFYLGDTASFVKVSAIYFDHFVCPWPTVQLYTVHMEFCILGWLRCWTRQIDDSLPWT